MLLEANYRERLLTVYNEVKKRLDYQVALQNLKRQKEQADLQKNMLVEGEEKLQNTEEKLTEEINKLKEKASTIVNKLFLKLI